MVCREDRVCLVLHPLFVSTMFVSFLLLAKQLLSLVVVPVLVSAALQSMPDPFASTTQFVAVQVMRAAVA